MPKADWQTQLGLLREDHRSGAQELAGRAMNLWLDAVVDSQPAGIISYRRWLLRTGRELIAAQPAMGILFRLVNDTLWACHEAMSGERVRQDALDFMQSYQAGLAARLASLEQEAAGHIAGYDAIVTHSRSSSVVAALRRLGEQGVPKRIYCGEGRPMYEGQTLANELAWAGHTVVLGVDMALFGWLRVASALVVGADSVSRDGIVNKLGTAALMRAAADLEVPRIVICSSDKLLPANTITASILGGGDPEEIMPVSEERITVRNDYFDVTPLELASVIVTDLGALAGERLEEELDRLSIYPGLRGG
jgi:translation initiation factor 2B subunit (eIF-2B alpha/beta/delta family)